MSKFAVIENDIVINIIVADSLEEATITTGKLCLEYTDEEPIGNGWEYKADKGNCSPPQVYPSWTLNEEKNQWEAPVAYPELGIHAWDEETLSWIPWTI